MDLLSYDKYLVREVVPGLVSFVSEPDRWAGCFTAEFVGRKVRLANSPDEPSLIESRKGAQKTLDIHGSRFRAGG